jgi:hypothetical protein
VGRFSDFGFNLGKPGLRGILLIPVVLDLNVQFYSVMIGTRFGFMSRTRLRLFVFSSLSVSRRLVSALP